MTDRIESPRAAADAARQRERRLRRRNLIVPALLAVLMGVAVAFLVLHVRTLEEEAAQSQFRVIAQQAVAQLDREVQLRLRALGAMARMIGSDVLRGDDEFEAQANAIHDQLPGFTAINRIDTRRTIVKVTPLDRNRAALGRRLDDAAPGVLPVVEDATAALLPRATPLVRLFQGGVGVATYTPIVVHGKFDGFVNGVLDMTTLVDDVVMRIDPSIQLLVSETLGNDRTAGDNRFEHRQMIQVLNRTWVVTVTVATRDIETWREPSYWLAGTALAFGLLSGVLLLQAASQRRRAQDYFDLNLKAERRLRESETFFHQLVDGVKDYAVYTIDEDGRITSWNLGAQRIYGYSPEETIGSLGDIFITDRDRGNGVLDRLRELMRTQGGYSVEGTRVRKNGEEFEASVSLSTMHDAEGRRSGYAVVTGDITQRVETARQLRQAQKLEAVGHLTGGIAHDFNNLLAIIIGNLSLARDDIAGGTLPIASLIEAPLRAARRGADLTHRLLAFSRRMPLQPVTVDVRQTIQESVRLLERTISEAIRIETSFPARAAWISVDPSQMENALVNLALNARDAMPEGGSIRIEVRTDMPSQTAVDGSQAAWPAENVCITVSDTGAGMSPETLVRAYEPFFTTKAVGKGSGLGLSMVYGFVRQSGGLLSVHSALGQGTTVTICLPRAAAATVAGAEARAGHPDVVGGDSATVLLVEDESDVRAVTARQLEVLGYKVNAVADGPAAISVLKSSAEIDIMLADMVLPGGLDGVAIVQEARKLRPGIRVLCMSGYTEIQADADRLRALGVSLLAKPFEQSALARALIVAAAGTTTTA